MKRANMSLSNMRPTRSSLLTMLKLWLLFSIPYLYLIFHHYRIDYELRKSILVSGFYSIAGSFMFIILSVAFRYLLMRRTSFFGGPAQLPGYLGIAAVTVFLTLSVLFVYLNFTAASNGILAYFAALESVAVMFLLVGFDDVLHSLTYLRGLGRKLMLPSVAALLFVMRDCSDHTSIITIPKPLVPYVGLEILDLGWMYMLHMVLLAVFCTNSINIHADVNGLEAGQIVVISCAILIHNIMEIGTSTDPEYKQGLTLSIYLVQPLLATSLVLLSYRYPASVFVGDTYTYFAGMTIALAGFLGHFSKTLVMFFAPQVLNLLISLPQLFGIISCQQRRLPRFDPHSGLLSGTNNGTLVNLFLRQFGPRSEKSLCIILLVFQALSCGFAFVLRWFLIGWYK